MNPYTVKTVTEELLEAANKALYEYTAGGTEYEEEHFRRGFIAGAKWNESEKWRRAYDSPKLETE